MTIETKTEVNSYLSKRSTCNGKSQRDLCKYRGFCPEYPPLSNIKDGTGCIILHIGKLDVFYNLFFAEADGLKNEMQRTLYKMQEDDPQQYIQACTKTMTTVYGTDGKADVVPPKVAITINRVGKSNTKVAKSNTKCDKNENK